MKTWLIVLLIIILSACLTCLIMLGARDAEYEVPCGKPVHDVTYVLNGDTVKVKTCRYSTKIVSLYSDSPYFYYCEHVKDSIHIKRVLPIGPGGVVKIIDYK